MITNKTIKTVIIKLIKSENYRIEIINLINEEFLQFAIEFLKKIVSSKLQSEYITIDWYKKAFIHENKCYDNIAIYSGINKKNYSKHAWL